jgi:hypothetical protein
MIRTAAQGDGLVADLVVVPKLPEDQSVEHLGSYRLVGGPGWRRAGRIRMPETRIKPASERCRLEPGD